MNASVVFVSRDLLPKGSQISLNHLSLFIIQFRESIKGTVRKKEAKKLLMHRLLWEESKRKMLPLFQGRLDASLLKPFVMGSRKYSSW